MPKSSAAAESIKWYRYDIGIDLAAAQKKKILVYFYTQWCPYCKKMDREVFSDPAVISFLNENFISIKVDMDKQKKLAVAFNVRGVPANWFLSDKGEKIGNIPGYVRTDMFMKLLKYVHSDGYKE
ncbi:MAG: thioredoxin family protein [Proteobacteria bacterium]|nr:thioredoxin family protein [Pseudomonadota bacterium]